MQNSKIQSARATKLGIDITGLSAEDAKPKFKQPKKIKS
jgi:hypothetical protein